MAHEQIFLSHRPVVHCNQDNCWQVVTAQKLVFLIDGAAYFEAFYRAALNVERSIVILSWDIDSRTRLLRNPSDVDGFPTELGSLRRRLLQRKQALRVHILNWDYSLIYAAERQWFQPIRFGWNSHPRLHFHLNNRHPNRSRQHEKLVVNDASGPSSARSITSTMEPTIARTFL